MAGLPAGTVTFLFTDLEGSTSLWEEHPDAMHAALAPHDDILRDAVAAHEGQIVKATGDGLHAVFAVAWAGPDRKTSRERQQRTSRPDEPRPPSIREYSDLYGSHVERAKGISCVAG
jgi:hypothetical protein